jgi:hypothetical protein
VSGTDAITLLVDAFLAALSVGLMVQLGRGR